MVIGSWDAHPGDHPRLARALSRGAAGSSTRASTPAAGRWPWPKDSTIPYSLTAACIGLGYSLPRQGRPRRRGPRARARLQRRPRGEPHAASSSGHPAAGRCLSSGRAHRRGRGPGASGCGGGRVEAAPHAAGGRARIARRGLPLRRSGRRGIDRGPAGPDPRPGSRAARGCRRRAVRARRGRGA